MEQARGAGLSADQVRQRVRSGRWIRLAHGVYRTRPLDAGDGWVARIREHADRAIAEATAHPGCRVGFESAAVVVGLPTWRSPGPDVSLIAPPGGHNGRRPGVIVHRLELHERDVVDVPIRMTSVARTWLDVTRCGRLVDGLVLGDAALRAGLMSADDVSLALESSWARRGIRSAKEAAVHLSGVRETPLESASWAYFIGHRLPLPRMQVEVFSSAGRFVGRVDFLWDRIGLVGECDGRLKYQSPDDVYAEKRREDDLRAQGYRILRWGAADLRDDRLANQIRRFHT